MPGRPPCPGCAVDPGATCGADCLQWAHRSGLAPIRNLARLVAAHAQGILNYFGHRITSSTCEGLNNAIATLSKRAYGYRNLRNLRTALLFHLGGLNLYPALPATHAIGR